MAWIIPYIRHCSTRFVGKPDCFFGGVNPNVEVERHQRGWIPPPPPDKSSIAPLCASSSFYLLNFQFLWKCMIQDHYYQSMFTLVGGGLRKFNETHRSTSSVIPKDCDWLQDKAKVFDPENRLVVSENGDTVRFCDSANSSHVHCLQKFWIAHFIRAAWIP